MSYGGSETADGVHSRFTHGSSPLAGVGSGLKALMGTLLNSLYGLSSVQYSILAKSVALNSVSSDDR